MDIFAGFGPENDELVKGMLFPVLVFPRVANGDDPDMELLVGLPGLSDTVDIQPTDADRSKEEEPKRRS